MKKLRVSEGKTGRYKLNIEFGGRPQWCSFEYEIKSNFDEELVIAPNPEMPSDEIHWFPFFREGMLNEYESRSDEICLVNTMVVITKIFWHSTDTDEHICKRYGRSFMRSLLAGEIDKLHRL